MTTALGAVVREARRRAHLSRGRLARLAGLSEGTLKNLEAGRHAVTTATLHALLRVPELALPPEALAGALGGVAQDVHLNAWIAPGFNPIDMYRQMSACYAGAGGHVEQTFAYFDHASAADWCAISGQEDYAAALSVLPLEQIAVAVAAQVGGAGLDLIALGPGDGHLETRLMVQVAQHLQNPAGRFFLVDISQPLLSAAYQRAADALAGRPTITPVAIQGDFHRLPQYHQLLRQPPGVLRRQLVCMIGGTFANLDNEVRFVRDSLCGFAAGSLLLLDYPSVFGGSVAEIQRRDPWLQTEDALRWRGRVGEFLAGPLRRYCPDADDIELSPELVQGGLAIPGSYAVEVSARVRSPGKPDRVFKVFRLKRYQTDAVITTLGGLGWSHVSGVRYGAELGYARTLSLFARC